LAEEVEKASSLDERAVEAKASENLMEQFIEDFKPFLHACASKYSHGSDDDKRQELFSTAMLAFYESVRSYDADKGHFYPFANNVIRMRIIDFIRGVYRREADSIPLDPLIIDDEDQQSSQTAALNQLSMRRYEEDVSHSMLVDEIEQFKAELGTWGITMEALSKHSPKHKALRDTYRNVVSQISVNADIIQTIQIKRYFPVKAVSEISGLPQKNVERARIFLLASLIIMMGDYDLLSDYVGNKSIR